MKMRNWRSAFILAGVAAVVVWTFMTNGNEPALQTRATTTVAAIASGEDRRAPHIPFLSSHDPLVPNTSTSESLDSSFHVELQKLRQRIRQDSTDSAAILQLAQMLHDGHQFREAIVEYRRYLELTPGNREAWLDIGQAYGSLQNWPAALAATDSVLARYPEDPAALYNKGAVLANMGHPREAREVWLRVEKQEQDPQLKEMAISALERLGQ